MVRISAVVDAACLIGLERINSLHLLPALLEAVIAPSAVVSEFGSQPVWLTVMDPVDRYVVHALELVLDHGESEAIALAQEKGLRVILDDRKAREVAARMGVPVTGTIGLILKAKISGIIPAVRPLLDALDACKFHVSRELREEALRLAGEAL